MKKIIINSILVGFTVLTAMSALAKTPMPGQCPSVAAIQNTPFIGAVRENGRYVVASIVDVFDKDTQINNQWAFGIVGIGATSKKKALEKAETQLKTLKQVTYTPQYVPEEDGWACIYAVDKAKYQVAAITPIPYR